MPGKIIPINQQNSHENMMLVPHRRGFVGIITTLLHAANIIIKLVSKYEKHSSENIFVKGQSPFKSWFLFFCLILWSQITVNSYCFLYGCEL